MKGRYDCKNSKKEYDTPLEGLILTLCTSWKSR